MTKIVSSLTTYGSSTHSKYFSDREAQLYKTELGHLEDLPGQRYHPGSKGLARRLTSCLIAVADDDYLPRIEVDFPALSPAIDIPFENDLGSVLKLSIHLPIAVRSDHIGKLAVASVSMK
jgi:hypothetical protein